MSNLCHFYPPPPTGYLIRFCCAVGARVSRDLSIFIYLHFINHFLKELHDELLYTIYSYCRDPGSIQHFDVKIYKNRDKKIIKIFYISFLGISLV